MYMGFGQYHYHGHGQGTVTLFTKFHGTVRSGTKNSRSRAKNETFTVLDFNK